MALKIKEKQGSKEVKEDSVINFGKEDYVAIKLNGESTVYAEHKMLAKKLVYAKKAEYVKGVEFETPKVTTQILG